jgi:hypothetical protein
LEIEDSVFDDIGNTLEAIGKNPSDYYKKLNKKIGFAKYDDLIIKLYLVIKTIFNSKGTRRSKGGFRYNFQKLKKENLIERLGGNLKVRIKEDLIKRRSIRKTIGNDNTINEFIDKMIEILLSIAKQLKWVVGFSLGETITLKINVNIFDKKNTAIGISSNQPS